MNYHLIGIKGSGMSALAQILLDLGHHVQGSDVEEFCFTEAKLKEKKVPIFPFGHVIKQDLLDLSFSVILGNAFDDEHKEVHYAKEKGLKVIRYHHFLQSLISSYSSVAISGTHGKTTTTGLLSHTLQFLSTCSYLIGDGTGMGKENSDFFTFEACEYKNHFHSYFPDYAVITNIDYDHPDFFHSLDDVNQSFLRFSKNVKKGLLIYGEDEPKLSDDLDIPIYTYGFQRHFSFYATIDQVSTKGTQFKVYQNKQYVDSFFIPLFGKHNVLNALSVISFCLIQRFDPMKIKEALSLFTGVNRRFSIETKHGYTLVDDYAHHPIEIKATIDAARQRFPNKKIAAVFQPHTFTRTRQMATEFSQSLSTSDHVFLCDIFGSAREKDSMISIAELLHSNKRFRFLEKANMGELFKLKDTIFVFMGAGDIQKYETFFWNIAQQKEATETR